ncbi:DUF5789 family protein [Natronorarus salvus]|uniref:DUF5789 family protein n=1 Tax=Natronorarus salvus TaxID=3117733 RepID=UPI002F264E38
MADNKRGRDKQADNEHQRQRERELKEARERGDEAEPIHDDPDRELGTLDRILDAHDYPTTSDELISAYGDREVETQEGWTSLDEVLATSDAETFDTADDARNEILELIHRK